MTSLSDRARAEAERRTVGAKDPRQYRFGFRDGARWASDQGPTEAEVEAGARALALITRGVEVPNYSECKKARAALLAARDARRAGR